MEVLTLGLNATNSDTDADGLSDGAEVLTLGTNATNQDTDGDGLLDGEEVSTHHTDANLPDTDGDGLTDYEELNGINGQVTNATVSDTDADGLSDGAEILTLGTNATNQDTDGDGYSDKVEITNGTDPLNPSDYPGKILPPDYSNLILIVMGIVIGALVVVNVVLIRKNRKLQTHASTKLAPSKKPASTDEPAKKSS
jgi:hypothetical protein